MSAQIISFHCILKNKLGKVLSSTFNHDVITEIESPDLLKALADGLKNLQKGEKRLISLSAEEAYGFYDPQMVVVQPREAIQNPGHLRSGDQVMIQSASGESKAFRVIQTTQDLVTLDGNHPFAGQDLIFEIEAVAVRAATSEEIAESSPTQPTSLLH